MIVSVRISTAALLGSLLFVACQDQRPAAAPESSPSPADGALSQEAASAPLASSPEAVASAEPAQPSSKASASQGSAEQTGEGGAPSEPLLPFPPPNFEPPFARSAQEGDGVWIALGPVEGDKPWMARTTVHPHEASRFLAVHVVALDLQRARLHYMPGADDVGDKKLPEPYQAGLIPPEHQEGLLAAFNGGFMPRHGRWGMKAAGVVIVPPKETGCTVALVEEGASGSTRVSTRGSTVRVEPWPALTDQEPNIPFYRQTPPCLLDRGELHPELKRNNEKPWGGFLPNLVTRRRSAIGVDAEGKTLFYAVGVEVGPRLLAEGLRYAGAVQAAELDINDNWTRFALFEVEAASGQPRVATMLLDDMVRQKSGYVVRPSARDFFYVRRGPR